MAISASTNLQLIIVDEEHDTSLSKAKVSDTPQETLQFIEQII